MKKQLQIEYLLIANQTFHSFSPTVQTFDECQLPIAHSVFKQCVHNVHQLQQHMIEVCCKITRLP